MDEPKDGITRQNDYVNRRLQKLAEATAKGQELSAKVAGTSEETAALFGSKPTLKPYD